VPVLLPPGEGGQALARGILRVAVRCPAYSDTAGLTLTRGGGLDVDDEGAAAPLVAALRNADVAVLLGHGRRRGRGIPSGGAGRRSRCCLLLYSNSTLRTQVSDVQMYSNYLLSGRRAAPLTNTTLLISNGPAGRTQPGGC
jgi:hypothetical protein